MATTVRVDTVEHVELWNTLVGLVNEWGETAAALGNSVYDEELVSEYDLPRDVIGKNVAEVGLPPKIVNPLIERAEWLITRVGEVRVPSPDAFRDYEIAKLHQKLDWLIERVKGEW